MSSPAHARSSRSRSPLEEGELTPEPCQRRDRRVSPRSGSPAGPAIPSRSWGRREQRHDDPTSAYVACWPSDSRGDSRRRDDRRAEPMRDRQDVASRQQGGHRTGLDEARGNRTAHQSTALSSARGDARSEHRPSVSASRGGRPGLVQIQLNKRIVAARSAEDILAIIEAEHGEFNAVNAATACNRLAKALRSSAHDAKTDDRRVQALFSTLTRVSSSMNAQDVANTVWALAKLGWQAAEEGAMRRALEGAAVRVAPSMIAQDVANTVWALATLGWQAGEEGAMRRALEGAAVRVAPSMNAQEVANTVWALGETEIRTARPPRGLSWAALAKQVLANWQTYR